MITESRNILYVMDYYFGTEGGTEKQVLELILSLDRKRYRPEFAALQSTAYIDRSNFPCEARVLNIKSMSEPSTILKMIRLAMDVYKSRIDLVHVFFNDAAVIAPIFCKIGGAKVITSRRDMGFWYTPMTLKCLRISHLFVDRIAVNSMAVKDNVVRLEGYPKSKIEVIYNGFKKKRFESERASDFRERCGIGPDDLIVGTVSNLYAVKRPLDLINAYVKVNEVLGNVHLVLVGGGPIEIEPLKEYVKILNIDRRVHFLGRIADAVPVIKHIDVCVSSSESEGLSNAILEYMGCSRPVVCTNVGGNPELIKDGFNGYLVNVGDVHCLADRIIRILSDDVLKITLGNNGRNTFLRKFTSDKMALAYMKLYDSVLNGMRE